MRLREYCAKKVPARQPVTKKNKKRDKKENCGESELSAKKISVKNHDRFPPVRILNILNN